MSSDDVKIAQLRERMALKLADELLGFLQRPETTGINPRGIVQDYARLIAGRAVDQDRRFWRHRTRKASGKRR
jgi:hypothetical protein